jgi:hypothetical protein
LDQLFALKAKTLAVSPVFTVDDYVNDTHRNYVAMVQGGVDMRHAGIAFFEADCDGTPVRKDSRALPDAFLTGEEKAKSGMGSYSTFGGTDLTACEYSFASGTGYPRSWGADEQ